MSTIQKVTYQDLINKDIDKSRIVDRAFGTEGLGILLVENYPSYELRENLLRKSREFAILPKEVKAKYEDAKSSYSFGWSCGVESMKNGVVDSAKGSYYANPEHDKSTDDTELKEKYPVVYSDNIWPESSDIKDFETYYKAMSRVMKGVGLSVCSEIDRFMERKFPDATQHASLTEKLKKCRTHKGRLLHYYPKVEETKTADGLCGWHLDHGFITTLLSPLFLDRDGREVEKPKDGGLYIISPHSGETIKVTIPNNCIAVQLGELSQYFTGGYMQATPHCVAASSVPNVSREQYALFLDVDPTQPLVLPSYTKAYNEVVRTDNLPPTIPLLSNRLTGARTYREFVQKTIEAYNK